jgi:hypothetical protein
MQFHISVLLDIDSILRILLPIFRRSARNIVLDDDDLELIRENKSLNQGKTVSFWFFFFHFL